VELRIESSGMIKFNWVWVVVVLGLLVAGSASASDVAVGDDVWQTPANGANHDFSTTPIPADFFEPGSDPFTGFVQLQGAGTGCFDTVVRRLDPASPLPVGGQQTVDIEIISLNLVSVDPITVTPLNDQWDIAVDLSQIVPQPIGSMTIKHQGLKSGTYDSALQVCSRMTFTRTVAPFDIRVLDICNDFGAGAAAAVGTVDAPWSHNVQLPLVCPNSSSDFLPEGPHTGPHPGAEPVETLAAPALTPIGIAIAVATMGGFAAWHRRRNRR
jgi:hypothetical protein